MRLLIDGQEQEVIPIRIFREQMQLPDSFGVQLFEPKDFAGLAAIDQAGAELNQLRAALLDTVPERLLIPEMLPFADRIVALFRAGLVGINEKVGLRIPELEFAVAGFGDVMQHWIYAVIRTRASRMAQPAFTDIYHQWLNQTVRVSQRIFLYPPEENHWQVQVLNHAYGRFGLRVQDSTHIYYVMDGIYACPAEGFMYTLLGELAERIVQAAHS